MILKFTSFFVLGAVRYEVPDTISSASPTSTSACATESDGASGKSSPPVGAIVGGVLAGVAGLAIMGFLAWFLLRKQKRKNLAIQMEQSYPHDQIESSTPTSPTYSPVNTRPNPDPFALSTAPLLQQRQQQPPPPIHLPTFAESTAHPWTPESAEQYALAPHPDPIIIPTSNPPTEYVSPTPSGGRLTGQDLRTVRSMVSAGVPGTTIATVVNSMVAGEQRNYNVPEEESWLIPPRYDEKRRLP